MPMRTPWTARITLIRCGELVFGPQNLVCCLCAFDNKRCAAAVVVKRVPLKAPKYAASPEQLGGLPISRLFRGNLDSHRYRLTAYPDLAIVDLADRFAGIASGATKGIGMREERDASAADIGDGNWLRALLGILDTTADLPAVILGPMEA